MPSSKTVSLESILADTVTLDLGNLFDTGAEDLELPESDQKILKERTELFAKQLQDAAKSTFGQMVEQFNKLKEEHGEVTKRLSAKRLRPGGGEQTTPPSERTAAPTESAAGTPGAPSGVASGGGSVITPAACLAGAQDAEHSMAAQEFMAKVKSMPASA